ncbi:MAG: DUF1573 domain-containing protein [Phycisphaerales bacterium]
MKSPRFAIRLPFLSLTLLALAASPVGGAAASHELAAVASAAGATTPAPAVATPAIGLAPATPAMGMATVTAVAAAPQLNFERVQHDFGKVWDFETYSTEFMFTNTGDADLTILAVKASCGCTATSLKKKVFAPGESHPIGVVFNPKGRGRQAKTITVLSDVGPPVVLTIRSEVRQFIAAEPQVVRLGTIIRGNEKSARVLVRCKDPNFVIERLIPQGTSGRYVTARVIDDGRGPRRPDDPLNADGMSTQIIEVTVAPNAPWGQLFSSIQISGTGLVPGDPRPTRRSSTFTVSGSVFGEVLVSDTMVRVSSVRAGEPFARALILTSRNGQALDLIDATLENPSFPGLRVEMYPDDGFDGRRWTVAVRGDPGDYTGRVSGQVVVRSRIPGEERMVFPVAGMIR